MVKGIEFSVHQPERCEKDRKMDERSCYSNANQNTVEIHGDIRSLGKELLGMYLENTSRSGGGSIERIDLDANPPLVTFCEAAGKYLKQVIEIKLFMLKYCECLSDLSHPVNPLSKRNKPS